jgi:hypothetical protein
MAEIQLTVVSVNNRNCTPFPQVFSTEKMHGVRANQNANNNITITEAGDTQNIMSAWALNTGVGSGIYEGQVLYWTFESTGNVRTVRIYANSTRQFLVAEGSATIANGANATVFFTSVGDSNIAGSVLVTIGGGGANDDTDAGNTLTMTNVTIENDLQLNGHVEFLCIENREVKTKYTVDEELAVVLAMIQQAQGCNGNCFDDPVVLRFIVRNELGQPVVGAWVIITDEDGNSQARQTDEFGIAEFIVENGEEFTYVVITEDCGCASVTGSVTAEGAVTVEMVEMDCDADDDSGGSV